MKTTRTWVRHNVHSLRYGDWPILSADWYVTRWEIRAYIKMTERDFDGAKKIIKEQRAKNQRRIDRIRMREEKVLALETVKSIIRMRKVK